MALNTIINYDTAGNFTFDAALIEFAGAPVRAKLLDLTPPNSTLGHSFNGVLDASWGGGVLTHTVPGGFNTPTVVAKRMVCESTDLRAIKLPFAGNAPATNVGATECILNTNYTGTPSVGEGDQYFIDIGNGVDDVNRVDLWHDRPSGQLRFRVCDTVGALIVDISTPFAPVAGVPQRLQANWNITSGESRLFLNGTQIGATDTSTGTRTTAGLTNIWLGTDQTETETSNFRMGNVVLYTTVQNTTTHTPAPEIADTRYSVADPTVLTNSVFATDAISDFTETVVKAGSDDVKYIMCFAGQDYYWNGSAWVISDGTFAQSNTAAEITTNGAHASLPEGNLLIKTFLHSDDGSTRPEIETLDITYSFFNTQATPPICTIWGFYRDVSGIGVPGATVTFSLVRKERQYREASDAIIEKPVVVTTDANGRFESDLVRSSAFEAGGTYIIEIEKPADNLETAILNVDNVKLEFTVPDATDENITDLLTSAA